MRMWLMAAAACLCAAPALAQTDAAGSKDHPLFPRMAGYYIEQYEAQDSSNIELDTAPPRRVEGHYWKISYALKKDTDPVGPVRIARNYTDLIVKRGGKTLVDDVDASGGTTVAQMPVNGATVDLELSVSNAGEVYSLTIVEEVLRKYAGAGRLEIGQDHRDLLVVKVHQPAFAYAVLPRSSAAAVKESDDGRAHPPCR